MADAARSYELNNPPVIAELLEGEIVAIDLDVGNYYCLRGKAAAVWGALLGGGTPEAIARRAGGEAGALLQTLLLFVDRLVEQKLLRPRAAAAGLPPPAVGPWTAEELTYETFTDMQNLLGLDPVHEADDQLGWPAPATTPVS